MRLIRQKMHSCNWDFLKHGKSLISLKSLDAWFYAGFYVYKQKYSFIIRMNSFMMFKLSSAFTLIFVMIFSNSVFGQSSHHHADSRYEFGISVGLAHLVHENENSLSAHIHFLRKLDSENTWERISLGLGFESIFAEHKHYSFLGTISINPIWDLIFDISPGILITEHDGSSERQFVTHFELTYEFEYKSFGIGPVLGFGVSENDNHLMVGLHLGKGF